MPIKPHLKSLIIADMVMQAQGTNKWSAIGIFSKILSFRYPVLHPSIGLYICLYDVTEGPHTLKLEYCDSDGKVLATFDGIRFEGKSRLEPVEIGIQSHGLPIPVPGKYDFKIHFDGDMLQSIPLEAAMMPSPNPPPPGPSLGPS